MAELNDATTASTREVLRIGASGLPHFPEGTEAWLAVGQQVVSKFRERAGNDVIVVLAVVRLISVETDLVISYNVPVNFASKAPSSPASMPRTLPVAPLATGLKLSVAWFTRKGVPWVGDSSSARNQCQTEDWTQSRARFESMLQSLRIVDWGLFSTDDGLE